MRYSLLSQAALIIVSLVIIFGVIKPTFANIGHTQDQVSEYKTAISNSSQLNAKLQELVSKEHSFSQDQIASLDAFLPDTIDSLKIMNEIETMFTSQNIPLASINSGTVVAPVGDVTVNGGSSLKQDLPTESYQDFTVTFSGSYQDLKNILHVVEANKTLLEVVALNFKSVSDTAISRDSSAAVSDVPAGSSNFTVTFRSYAVGTPLVASTKSQ